MAVDTLTEYFNGYKWKSVKDYEKGEKVLQYNSDGTATLVIPYDYSKILCANEPFFEYLDPSLPLCLTRDHLVVIKENGYLQLVPYSNLKSTVEDKDWHMPIACEYHDSIGTRSIHSTNELECAIESYRKFKVDDGGILKWFLSEDVKIESLGFSDRVFTLAERDRRKLIGSIVQSEHEFVNRDAVQSFVNVSNITPGYVGLYSIKPTHNGYTLKSTYNELTVSYSIRRALEQCVRSFYGYYFGVPSQMMVFRRKGSIFITGGK